MNSNLLLNEYDLSSLESIIVNDNITDFNMYELQNDCFFGRVVIVNLQNKGFVIFDARILRFLTDLNDILKLYNGRSVTHVLYDIEQLYELEITIENYQIRIKNLDETILCNFELFKKSFESYKRNTINDIEFLCPEIKKNDSFQKLKDKLQNL